MAKRRVKNPETFREQALKVAAEGNKTSKNTKNAKPKSEKQSKPRFRFIRSLVRPFTLLGRLLAPGFIRRSFSELKLVTWPSWHQSLRLTRAVLIFAIIFGLTIAGLDYVLDKIFRKLILS